MKKNFLTATIVVSCLSLATASAQEYIGTARLTSASQSPITLRVNNNYEGVTVDWGDGTPVLYNERTGTEREITGTPIGTVVISGYEGWEMLDCSDCQVTSLDISVATNLKSVFCQNNRLTELDLRGMNQLTDLDCGNNQITRLVLTDEARPETDLPKLEMFNAAGNKLTQNLTVRSADLQFSSISGNRPASFFVTGNANLKALYCDGCGLKALNLSYNPLLTTVVAYDNAITKASTPAAPTEYCQLLMGGAKFNNNQLNLGGCTGLYDLDVNRCGLESLTMPGKVKANSLNFKYNRLPLGVLPIGSYQPNSLVFEPQYALDILGADGVINENGIPRVDVVEWSERNTNPLDLSEYRYINVAEGATPKADATFTWYSMDEAGQLTELVKGTSSNPSDYYATNGKFAFFTPQKKAVCRATSATYGFTIEFNPIAIGTDVTAITTVNGENGLRAWSDNGCLVINGSQLVSVFNITGKKVWSGTATPEGKRIQLPKGIYVVGGKKVLNR